MIRRDLILLVDDGADSQVAKRLCEQRQVGCSVVHVSTIRNLRPETMFPTLFVGGTTYAGLKEVKFAVSTNRYLYR